jgi:hypothetical protein
MSTQVVGWAHAPLGRRPEQGLQELIGLVAGPTLVHAGPAPEDLDAVRIDVFAQIARTSLGRCGDRCDSLAHIAAKNHHKGVASRLTPAGPGHRAGDEGWVCRHRRMPVTPTWVARALPTTCRYSKALPEAWLSRRWRTRSL